MDQQYKIKLQDTGDTSSNDDDKPKDDNGDDTPKDEGSTPAL